MEYWHRLGPSLPYSITPSLHPSVSPGRLLVRPRVRLGCAAHDESPEGTALLGRFLPIVAVAAAVVVGVVVGALAALVDLVEHTADHACPHLVQELHAAAHGVLLRA